MPIVIGARPKKSKQKARKARPARLADCAVRILHLKLPAPEYYADKEPVELCVVHALEEKPPILLSEADILIAKIGGYLNRKKDPPPEHQILWHGYLEFQYMCMGFALMEEDR